MPTNNQRVLAFSFIELRAIYADLFHVGGKNEGRKVPLRRSGWVHIIYKHCSGLSLWLGLTFMLIYLVSTKLASVYNL